MRARSTHRRRVIATLCVAGAVGCGGDDPQDVNEPEGDFEVELVDASFPSKQKLAKPSELEITVRNSGSETVPDLAVTVEGFGTRSEETDLADPTRPVFAVNGEPVQIGTFAEARDAAPRGCDTAFVNTWACGPLEAGDERTLRWSVTAVRTGAYEISYRVAAGLNGKARAVLAGGGVPEGAFSGQVSGRPNRTLVGPDGRSVVNEPEG